LKRFRRKSGERSLLAESLRVRSISAIAIWLLIFPLFSLVAIAGGEIQGVLSSWLQLFGAVVVGVGLGVNYWYFPRMESFIKSATEAHDGPTDSRKHSASRMNRLLSPFVKPVKPRVASAIGDDNPRLARLIWTTTNTTPPKVPSSSLKADILAVLLSTAFIIGAQSYDFASGTCCHYFGTPVAFPWGYILQILDFIGYWYFTTVGLSLLFHYTLRWRLLAQWIRVAKFKENPTNINREEWGAWEDGWRAYCTGMRAISEVFFKGFITVVFVIASAAVTWVYLSRAPGRGLHPAGFGTILSLAFSILLYFWGPSYAASRKVDDVHSKLRKIATRFFEQEKFVDGESKGFPSLIGSIWNISDVRVLDLRHGSVGGVFGAIAFAHTWFPVVVSLVQGVGFL
jgi:hypothetical protein